LRVEEHRCPGDCPGPAIFVGPEDLKQRFESEHPGYETGRVDDLAKNAETFVQMAIDEKVPGVGPPISVLVIRPNGLEWRKGKPCKAESGK
jgi:hypothetical protein